MCILIYVCVYIVCILYITYTMRTCYVYTCRQRHGEAVSSAVRHKSESSLSLRICAAWASVAVYQVIYDDVTYVYDDVTYVYDDVTYVG